MWVGCGEIACFSVVDPYSVFKKLYFASIMCNQWIHHIPHYSSSLLHWIIKKYLRAVMFCFVSLDLGPATFFHWLQMAAVLLSSSASDKRLMFTQPFLFSHAWPFGSRQQLRIFVLLALDMDWTLILSISSSCMTSMSHFLNAWYGLRLTVTCFLLLVQNLSLNQQFLNSLLQSWF